MSANYKARQIYQIGDVAFHAHNTEHTQIRVKSRGKSEDLQDSVRVLQATSPHKAEIRSEKITMLIWADGLYGTAEYIQKLLNLVGVPTLAISYEMHKENADTDDETLACGCAICGCCECVLNWFEAAIVVQDVSISNKEEDFFEASITVEYGTPWRLLNIFRWDLRDAGAQISPFYDNFEYARYQVGGVEVAEVDVVNMVSYPPKRCADLVAPCSAFYYRHYSSSSFIYSPAFWTTLFSLYDDDVLQPGYSAYYNRSNIDWVFIPPHGWSSTPSSFYVAKDIAPVISDTTSYDKEGAEFSDAQDYEYPDDTTIRVEYIDGLFRYEYTTTVDWQAVYEIALAAGYDLTDGDKTYLAVFGDVSRHGFIIEANTSTPLVYIASAITRTGGDFPGMLAPNSNRVTIESRDAPIAMTHIFQRY